MQPWDTHEPVGDWMPLASAPRSRTSAATRSATGCRRRAAEPAPARRAHGRRRAGRAAVAAVQRQPYCVTRAGAAATIVEAAPSCSSRAAGPTRSRCRSGRARRRGRRGQSSTGSFSVGVAGRAAAGRDARALPGAADRRDVRRRAGRAGPPGGSADMRCPLDAREGRPTARSTGTDVVPGRPTTRTHGAQGSVHAAGRVDVRRRAASQGRRREFSRNDVRRDRGPRRSRSTSGATPASGAPPVPRPRSKRPRFGITAEWRQLGAAGTSQCGALSRNRLPTTAGPACARSPLHREARHAQHPLITLPPPAEKRLAASGRFSDSARHHFPCARASSRSREPVTRRRGSGSAHLRALPGLAAVLIVCSAVLSCCHP